MQVAKGAGVERLVGPSEGLADLPKAARNIRLGLSVNALKGTNIITVSYKNKDSGARNFRPERAYQPILYKAS